MLSLASLTYFFGTKEKTKKKKALSLRAWLRCQGFLEKILPGFVVLSGQWQFAVFLLGEVLKMTERGWRFFSKPEA